MVQQRPGQIALTIITLAIILLGGMYLFSNNEGVAAADADPIPTPGTTRSTSGYNVTETTPPSVQQTTAPNFSLTLLDGQTIQLSDYRGEKPVVVDFWASWCHNCQRNFSKMSKLYETYKDDVEFIGINMRESQSAAQRFINRTGATFPNGIDQGSIINQYGVRYTNTKALIDKDGNLVNIFSGDLTEAQIQQLIN